MTAKFKIENQEDSRAILEIRHIEVDEYQYVEMSPSQSKVYTVNPISNDGTCSHRVCFSRKWHCTRVLHLAFQSNELDWVVKHPTLDLRLSAWKASWSSHR